MSTQFLVTGTCLTPVVYTHQVKVTASDPRGAVVAARAAHHWLPGCTFGVRPAPVDHKQELRV